MRGDRGKLEYTGQNMYHLQLLPGFFTLPRTFFITIFPTAFYDRSRMTGMHLAPFRKELFGVSDPTCPFRRLRRHLPRQAGTACGFLFFPLFTVIRGTACGLQFSFHKQTTGTFFVGAISLFCGFTYIKIYFISVYFNKNSLFQRLFSFQ